ncbi:hypothetical protein DWF04_006140 [Cereibacter sphaeroides f. sp. denitrificans]|nr:hypothetical protein DWF04_06070 [Cereibacter sphaeroides f. sp. denitrificans]
MLNLRRNIQEGDEIRIGPVRARLTRIGRWCVQVDAEGPAGRTVQAFRHSGEFRTDGISLRLSRIGPAAVLMSVAAPQSHRIETSWPRSRATQGATP